MEKMHLQKAKPSAIFFKPLRLTTLFALLFGATNIFAKDFELNFYTNPHNVNFILKLNAEGKTPADIGITDINVKEVYPETISTTGKINKAINL